MRTSKIIKDIACVSAFLLPIVTIYAQPNTAAGVEGYDALYGQKQPAKEILPNKWIPRTPPNPNPDAQWFPSAALGLFQHWGIVSKSPRGEAWDMRIRLNAEGTEASAKSLQNAVSPEKMFGYAKDFNPKRYNPDQWMKDASAAGFRYAVLTTRHHDAYFLGDSKFGNWHAGHWLGRDLIKPWAEACRNHGIKVGFYFSGPDWYHGHEYQNYSFPEKKDVAYNWKHEKVSSIPAMPPALSKERKAISHGQIRELLTNYGKVDLVWPDGGFAGFDFKEAYKLQPGMIIGRDAEYATPEGWDMMKMEYIKEANRRGYSWEFCTIGHGGSWHWSPNVETSKPTQAASILKQLAQVRARGGNLLINIAPSPEGEMPSWFGPMCAEMAEWMKTGAEAIYDINTKGPFPYPDQCKQPVTTAGNTWYVFHSAAAPEIEINDVEKPESVTMLRTGVAIPYTHKERKLVINCPQDQRTKLPDVIKLVWSKN